MDLNENQSKIDVLEGDQNSESYVENTNRAIFGCVNGILFYDFIYPYALLIIAQIIFGAGFIAFVDEQQYLSTMILSLLNSLVTLTAAIMIAKPSKLKKAYKMIDSDDIRLMFTTFILMMGVTIGYNLFLTLVGFNVGTGNTNQSSIENYITNIPILSVIVFVAIGPVLEEITYRYFLFGVLRKINPKFAIIASGFVFMLVHGVSGFISADSNILREIILLPPYMFSGCMLAYAYNKSNNLATSTGVHVANNLLSFIMSCL